MDRKLSLRKETFTQLTPDELEQIAGGYDPTGPQPTPPVYALTHNCPTNYCVPFTDACPSVIC